MVYSFGGGLRSFVQVAAVCAFALSGIPTVQAQSSDNDSATGSVAEELPGSCGVSDGDKTFGIQVVTDLTCAAGGLGCYNDHCRYCKILDTLKSAHLESCESLGASFPTMAPLTISTGQCNVSSGDAAVGVAGMTDPSCLYGGIGCFNDHCRFCQTESTPQSSQFLSCPWVEVSTSTGGSMDSDAGDAGFAPILNNDDAEASEVSLSTRGSDEDPFEATTKVCTTTVSEGDAAVGINIMTDETCANGGVGCMDDICRMCQAKSSPQSAHLQQCSNFVSTVGTTPSCTQVVSEGDAANGIKIVTDTTCAQGGLGCIDNVCRFCRTTTTAQSASYVGCALTGSSTTQTATTPAPTTVAPVTNSPAPVITTAPATSAPVVPTSSKQTCSQTVSDGDAAVGIKIVTDTTCSSGGVGCIDQVCRFCRVTTSVQSSSFVDCATIKDTTSTAATSAPTTAPLTTAISTTPSIVFECSRTVSSGDKGVGLDIVSDIRCSDGGTGCVSDVCRFCKQFDTIQSQSYMSCSSIPSADVGSDITFVPIPVVDDSTAPTRMLASANAMDSLNSIGASNSVDATNSTDAPNTTDESFEATTASVCTMTISAGDAAVGINIVTDTSCSSGGTGCINNVCRYCKTKDTTQSAHFNSCPATTTTSTSTATTKGCATTVSDGDAAIGINIITDVSCANGGLGCMDSVCRLCKTKSTDQSAHLGSCSDYTVSTSSAPASTAPVATIAPVVTTAAPVSTTSTYSIPLECYQSASSGDTKLGLDIVTDIRCGDGGVGCVDSTCRFCKRFETTQSHSYMNCSDIPSSDNGADINFKGIVIIDDTQTQKPTSSDTIVALHESAELTSEFDEVCVNVPLADGQAAGGVGVVLDNAHCPEGLTSGCIGDAGCRYCMRFPTNVSDYLEYCAIVNSTDVSYALSGVLLSIEEGSTHSADVDNASTRSVEAGSAISVEERATNSNVSNLVKSEWFVGAMACVGVIGIMGLTAFSIKRTMGSLARSSARSLDKERVIPDDENRPSVLITSNVGEPGDISDV